MVSLTTCKILKRAFNLGIINRFNRNYICYSQQKIYNLNYTSSSHFCDKASKKTKESHFEFFTWKRIWISLGIGLISVAGVRYLKAIKDDEIDNERRKQVGKMLIGGDWSLTDPLTKEITTNKDFFGKWILIYFGFTHCPDICPDEIEKMCKVVDVLNDDIKKGNFKKDTAIMPLFISVDPERDSPPIIKKYCEEFSDKLIGLVGTPDETKDLSKTFRVYYSQGPSDKNNDYIVDHTIITYLMNPKGEFVDYFGRTKTAEEIANNIRLHIFKYDSGAKGLKKFFS